jgi:hypothetical protein
MSIYGGYGAPKPAPLLTRAQLAARHPGTNYGKYVQYVNRTRARRAAARTVPFQQALGPMAALVPPIGQQQATAASLYPTVTPKQAAAIYPTVSNEDMTSRAKAFVAASLNPLVEQITRSNQATTQRGVDWINAYAQGAAADLSSMTGATGAAYDESLRQQGAIDTALQGVMGGAGQAAGQEAGRAISGFGQDGGASAAEIGTLGAGAGAAALGIGSAARSQMLSDRAANMTYAGMQPAVAMATGQQQLGDYTNAQAGALQSGVDKISAQAPGLMQGLIQDYQDQNIASLSNQAKYLSDMNTQALANRAKFISDTQANMLTAALGWQGVKSSAAKTSTPRMQHVRGPDGKMYSYDPSTGFFHDPVSGKVVRPGAARPKPTKLNIITRKDGSVVAVNPVTQKATKIYGALPTKPGTQKPIKLGDGRWGYYDPNTHTITVAGGANPAALPKQPTNTGPWYIDPHTRKPALSPGYHMKNGKVVADAPGQRATTGTTPRRTGVANGKAVWRAANGAKLNEPQRLYWDALYHAGYVDGRGKIIHPIPPGWKPGDAPASRGGGGGGGSLPKNFKPSKSAKA